MLKPVMSIDEAMAEDAPVVHDEPVVYVAGAPDTLEDDNSHAAQRGEHMIINFPIGLAPEKYRRQYSWSYWRYGQRLCRCRCDHRANL
ncbi:hypothetical protein ACVXG9_19385 [Escherichia coli]